MDSKGSQKVTPGLECSIDISCLSFDFLQIHMNMYLVNICRQRRLRPII